MSLAIGCGDDGSGTENLDGSTSSEMGTTTADDPSTATGSTAADETGSSSGDASRDPLDPATAPHVEVDRFSADAGMLFVRDDANGLPGPNEPVDFDSGPFITQGLGPAGEVVRYYNFDVQPTAPIPIWVLIREGEDAPVDGQLNIVDSIPGDAGYNDFWSVVFVTVPADYVANTVTSYEQIVADGYATQASDIIVNCPVVPEGSSASMRLGDAETGLTQGWYRDQVVHYFEFSEAALTQSGGGVPLSPIYVTFNVNPDQPDGGPPSGFLMETGSDQTHNVIATLPGDAGYSPLWMVNIYDNADFDGVSDLTTAQAANVLVPGAANVNCPVVSME